VMTNVVIAVHTAAVSTVRVHNIIYTMSQPIVTMSCMQHVMAISYMTLHMS